MHCSKLATMTWSQLVMTESDILSSGTASLKQHAMATACTLLRLSERSPFDKWVENTCTDMMCLQVCCVVW